MSLVLTRGVYSYIHVVQIWEFNTVNSDFRSVALNNIRICFILQFSTVLLVYIYMFWFNELNVFTLILISGWRQYTWRSGIKHLHLKRHKLYIICKPFEIKALIGIMLAIDTWLPISFWSQHFTGCAHGYSWHTPFFAQIHYLFNC